MATCAEIVQMCCAMCWWKCEEPVDIVKTLHVHVCVMEKKESVAMASLWVLHISIMDVVAY